MGSRIRFVELLILIYSIKQIASKVEFTNVKCIPLDPEFATFDYCFLKSVNRTYKYLSLRVKLLQRPVTKIKVNVSFLRRYSGYKPFMYNVTVDACRFIENPKANPIAYYIYNFFAHHSNMNHSCPIDEDVVVEKLPTTAINKQVTDVLPVPRGDYLFQSNWLAYDINRATVSVYVTIS
uniref:Uncharacterized protein LOC108041914 n=1 Tax=Drosophila rhopaloa TaxID=1041015 RepID=A0A6P4EBN5_DRORH